MKTILPVALTLLTLLAYAETSRAVPLRYALILGNNVGVDANREEPFLPLKLAEKESMVLRDALVRLSNFDPSRNRTRLLTGATRRDVREAIRALVRQKQKDEQRFADTESLFLFYFTGHGLKGELLLDDGPLSAAEVGEMFRSMDADFSVGVFDACYSGSLEDEALNAKGVISTPGFNLFRELPEEVLSAEGRIWYVSSGPGQASYEDEKLGGVFTHYFIEALSRAPRDGPGITLDRIWDYARQHTVEFTSSRNRRQVPAQYIAKLKINAPIYFSFPEERSATLVLSESIEGEFALSYTTGQLTEVIQKPAGKTSKIAVYPGKARLMLIRNDTGRTVQDLYFSQGGEVVLRHLPEERPATAVGQRSDDLWEKGVGLERAITATAVRSGLSVLGGAAYGYDYSDPGVLLPQHAFSLAGRLDYDRLVVDLRAGYGLDKRDFEDWGYKADSLVTGVQLGYGLDFASWRLKLAAGLQTAAMWQRFPNGATKQSVALRPALHAGALFPTRKKVMFELSAQAGPTRSPASSINGEPLWSFSGGAALTVYYRLR